MRIKRDYSHLPIDEQISKLKRNIKFYYIFGIIFNVCVAILSVILIFFTPEVKFGIGCLATIPISLLCGVYMQTKDAKEKITKLERQKMESELSRESHKS